MSPLCGELGEGSERISPDARHREEREVFPVEEGRSKKRRVESEEDEELETEETIDPTAFKEFEERMKENGIERSNGAWDLLFDEEVVARLKERNPSAWMRIMRQRSQDAQGRSTGAEDDQEVRGPGASGEVEPDEGRAVKIPIFPYVPTVCERR